MWTVQAQLILFAALLLLYTANAVRNSTLFDKNSSAQEVAKSRDRVGTPKERAGDNTTAGLSYVGNSLLLAVILLAYFLSHKGG